jgi:hypothetical protein
MKLRGEIYSIDELSPDVYELIIGRKTKGQIIHACFLLLGKKWMSDLSILSIGENVDVEFFVKARQYQSHSGKVRWSNSLIANKIKYDKGQQFRQSTIYDQFSKFNKVA